ncbi:MAG: FHA domain-containing protein [Planctomycetaceae bacterium]
MGLVTFQLLDGLERGEVRRDLPTPVTIGREEENDIRLNDERVSRFHVKIQEHAGQVILTDLDSTNGTRINGHPVRLHILQLGDQILIGRCLLVYGSPEAISEHFRLSGNEVSTISIDDDPLTIDGVVDCPDLFPNGPPALPADLGPLQRVQLSDVIAFAHSKLLRSLYSVQGTPNLDQPLADVTISAKAWHRMQQLQMDLAVYLKMVSEPSIDD